MNNEIREHPSERRKRRRTEIQYRNFRLNQLNDRRLCHLKLLLFWPVFLFLFQATEHFFHPPQYHVIYSPLDDLIPFCEWFLIPYLLWFVYIAGMLLYTLWYDINSFRRMMKFIIITYTAALVIYWLYPSCQELRPETFARDNLLTRFMAAFYRFDTNTNVCPSIHVIGAIAVWAAGWNANYLRNPWWKIGFTVTTILICLSTVFLKQHSVIDIFAALPICLIAYLFCYRKKEPSAA